jgi:hypothetical protein
MLPAGSPIGHPRPTLAADLQRGIILSSGPAGKQVFTCLVHRRNRPRLMPGLFPFPGVMAKSAALAGAYRRAIRRQPAAPNLLLFLAFLLNAVYKSNISNNFPDFPRLLANIFSHGNFQVRQALKF